MKVQRSTNSCERRKTEKVLAGARVCDKHRMAKEEMTCKDYIACFVQKDRKGPYPPNSAAIVLSTEVLKLFSVECSLVHVHSNKNTGR